MPTTKKSTNSNISMLFRDKRISYIRVENTAGKWQERAAGDQFSKQAICNYLTLNYKQLSYYYIRISRDCVAKDLTF